MIDVPTKERQAQTGLDSKLKEIVEDEANDRRSFVYCAMCSNVLARAEDRIEVSGSHAHQFTNPFDVEFHIGCYSDALGCSISGQRVAADTWFPGFQWRYAHCSECHRHLGWYFDQAEVFFYGLILDRIQHD